MMHPVSPQPQDLDSDTFSAQDGQYFAAIDLGSNSFHLLLTRFQHGRFIEVERSKQLVQLARDIDSSGNLCPAAQQRALNCLQCFRDLLDRYPQATVNTAATKALRMASNRDQFLQAAEKVLGTSVRLISGDEEAELVYQGINYHMHLPASHSLVIDIGGASTEIICGKGADITIGTSVDLGCVTSADLFFKGNRQALIPAEAFQTCLDHAREVIVDVAAQFANIPWNKVYSASGTLTVIADLLDDHSPAPIIEREQIKALAAAITSDKDIPAAIAENLRYDVLPAGIAILVAIFDVFSIDRIYICNAGLKEGLLTQALLEKSTVC